MTRTTITASHSFETLTPVLSSSGLCLTSIGSLLTSLLWSVEHRHCIGSLRQQQHWTGLRNNNRFSDQAPDRAVSTPPVSPFTSPAGWAPGWSGPQAGSCWHRPSLYCLFVVRALNSLGHLYSLYSLYSGQWGEACGVYWCTLRNTVLCSTKLTSSSIYKLCPQTSSIL